MSQSLKREPSKYPIATDPFKRERHRWYALRVRSRHEKKVASCLEQKSIEISLPLLQVSRQWSDRKKLIQEPLFRGYVFTRIPLQFKRYEVLQTPGAVTFSGIGGKIKAIPDEQMYWLDQILNAGEGVLLERNFPVGQQVRVTGGPWRGIEGFVEEIQGNARLLIWFDTLMQGVCVNMDDALLEPLNRDRRIR